VSIGVVDGGAAAVAVAVAVTVAVAIAAARAGVGVDGGRRTRASPRSRRRPMSAPGVPVASAPGPQLLASTPALRASKGDWGAPASLLSLPTIPYLTHGSRLSRLSLSLASIARTVPVPSLPRLFHARSDARAVSVGGLLGTLADPPPLELLVQ
jgi:hypothetical protein